MERSEMLAFLAERGIVPELSGRGGVRPVVQTCSVCGGYRSVCVPGMEDDGSGRLRGDNYVHPALALAYAGLVDELLAEAGKRPVGQLDRGACSCDHEHAWEFAGNLGRCLNRYRCTVPGCKATVDIDSSD